MRRQCGLQNMVGYRYSTNITWETGSNLLLPDRNQRMSYLRTVHYMTAIVKHDVNMSSLRSAITINLATGVA